MPIKVHYSGGKSYFQFGKSGKKYYYTAGNKLSRAKAKAKCLLQSKAIKVNKKQKGQGICGSKDTVQQYNNHDAEEKRYTNRLQVLFHKPLKHFDMEDYDAINELRNDIIDRPFFKSHSFDKIRTDVNMQRLFDLVKANQKKESNDPFNLTFGDI